MVGRSLGNKSDQSDSRSTSYSDEGEARERYTTEDAYSDEHLDRLERDATQKPGGGKENAVSILMRLAETLGADEGRGFDEESSDSQPLKKDVGAMSQGEYDYPDLMDSFPSNHKKGYKKRQARHVADEEEEEEEEPEEFKAAPFYADPEDPGDPEYDPKVKFPLPKEAKESGKSFKFYNKKRRINWFGSTVVFLYCVALIFYLFIRITKTMSLGSYLIYGIFVLFVEVMGATTTLLYGVNLLMTPVYDPIPIEEGSVPEVAKVAHQYHIRVLVPCYRESLELVQRTVTAALGAQLPTGCRRTVYLCDDGKDAQKRKWCQRMGAGVEYVSGRSRSKGEMNGKSANLNNCLMQLYPEDRIIPHNELVCIFDADQLANSDFYNKTVPLFDGGDDVGMVLSPQAFHNLNVHADIFNHSNIHFWEYSQPGYDALGFISCTGTNFLTRATALHESGWSPTYTLTEDFALGMIMKANRWHCCYVEDYLAVGEAPEQIRNCFQQRSRWAKGHFQVVLSRRHCPLFHKGLPFGMRILYCSGVWAYVVGALTTPTFMIIPLLTIWAGIFPIVISWWAALALTVYFIAQSAVISFSKKASHIESLWFAGVANNILWFTFVKAAVRSLWTKLIGQTITFKSTLKGINKLADSSFGDLWMPFLSAIVMCVTLGFGIQKLAAGPTVITTLAISVVWIVYGLVPPYLLFHYAIIGRGSTLKFMSRVAFVVHYLCGICALLLLWAVYPKDFDFGTAAKDSILFMDAQRLGTLPADNPIPWRGNSLTYEGSPTFPDLTGGWMFGGQLGTLKLTMPLAYTVGMTAWGLLAFREGYAKAGETQHAMESVKWGTDYLLKTFKVNAGANNVTVVYQVGNLTSDQTFWAPPENMTQTANPRPVFRIDTVAGTSDLTGQMVGAFASAAVVQSKMNQTNGQNGTYYTTLMDAAKTLYSSATTYQGRYTQQFTYDCVSPYAKARIGSNVTAPPCVAPTSYNQGSALAVYNSTTFYDDLVWAASWMYYATGNASYLADAQNFYDLHLNSDEASGDSALVTNWNNVFWASNVLLANLTGTAAYHDKVRGMLKQWICGTNGQIRFTPRGRAWNTADGATGITANTAFLALMYGEMDSPTITAGQKTRYICFSRTQTRYLLGDGGRSLMTGYGKNPPTHVQNRAASCASKTDCTQANGLLAGTPNPHVLSGAIPVFADFSDSYQDLRTSNSSRVDLGNNAAIAGVSAGLTNAPGTWEQCLQGFGVLTKDTAVCDNANI